MNRFQRCASNYAYYGYLNRFAPETLRTYQSERHFVLGRKGAYDTLVYKMAADHINYEEEMNQQYKTPIPIVNLWMRVAWFLFVVPGVLMFFCLDDMVRIFVPHKYNYIGMETDATIPTRYESLYAMDRIPKFWLYRKQSSLLLPFSIQILLPPNTTLLR